MVNLARGCAVYIRGRARLVYFAAQLVTHPTMRISEEHPLRPCRERRNVCCVCAVALHRRNLAGSIRISSGVQGLSRLAGTTILLGCSLRLDRCTSHQRLLHYSSCREDFDPSASTRSKTEKPMFRVWLSSVPIVTQGLHVYKERMSV